MKSCVRNSRSPGFRVVLLTPPFPSRNAGQWALRAQRDSSPVTVAGAAPAFHRLPEHRYELVVKELRESIRGYRLPVPCCRQPVTRTGNYGLCLNFSYKMWTDSSEMSPPPMNSR